MGPSIVLGHLALHYRPGDEQPARRLLELLGCTLVDNGPAPGSDGFCTVLVDKGTGNYADNLMFLSQLPPAQVAVEDAIRAALGIGSADGDLAVGLRSLTTTAPEALSHIGLRYRSFDDLERVLEALDGAAGPGGELGDASKSSSTGRGPGWTLPSMPAWRRRPSSPATRSRRSPTTGCSAS